MESSSLCFELSETYAIPSLTLRIIWYEDVESEIHLETCHSPLFQYIGDTWDFNPGIHCQLKARVEIPYRTWSKLQLENDQI